MHHQWTTGKRIGKTEQRMVARVLEGGEIVFADTARGIRGRFHGRYDPPADAEGLRERVMEAYRMVRYSVCSREAAELKWRD